MLHQFIDRKSPYTVAALSSASIGKDVRFEWQKTLEDMGVNALHIADDARSWWHSCIDDALEIIDKHRANLIIGASMGGYGALLFGGILGVPVRAFAPQTSLYDRRWEEQLAKVRKETKYPEYIKLNMSGEQYEIHYCAHEEEDRQHAERLPGVKRVPYECDHHLIAQKVSSLAGLLQ